MTAVVLAVDLVSVALVIGVLVLGATSLVSSTAAGSLAGRRRARRRQEVPPVRPRRIVTGPPAIDRDWLGPPPAPRHVPSGPDVQVDDDRMREAADLVDYLIVNDPVRLTHLVAQVLQQEHRTDAPDAGRTDADPGPDARDLAAAAAAEVAELIQDVVVMPNLRERPA